MFEDAMQKVGSFDLQLLVLELAFKLLRFSDLADSLVEIVLVDGVTVIFDGEQTARRMICQYAGAHVGAGRRTHASVTTFLKSAPLSWSLILTTLS
jgi:hypothetical protein